MLAFVIEWIARRDIAPSFGNIIREQKMSDTRAKQLVAQGKVEQISGDVRSIRVRDVAGSRNQLDHMMPARNS